MSTPLIDPDDPRHGTVNAYVNLWCRCGECRRAWATYKRRWRNADPARRAAHAESSRRYRAMSAVERRLQTEAMCPESRDDYHQIAAPAPATASTPSPDGGITTTHEADIYTGRVQQ